MHPTSTYFTKATMLVAVLVMFLSACKKGDEISPAQQQFNTEMETLQAIFKSYGVSAEKVESRMTTKETNIQSVDFSALDLTSMDERLYTIRIQKTIDLRDNQLDMEVINTVKAKFPKVEVLVSGNPPYEQDIELETLEKLGVSADSERVVKNAEGFVSELDLSGMDKVELDSAIFEFPYLTKLNLANNDLQFYHFQTLKNSIDGIELNFEGNPIYEISMTEISRFQEYLDFNEVKANAEEVLTFYTNDNAVSDEALPEGSSLGYIATINLSAQNIADLALPTEDFVVLRTKALEIDLSNSSFDFDSMIDPKRVGAIYPTIAQNNSVLRNQCEQIAEEHQYFTDEAKRLGIYLRTENSFGKSYFYDIPVGLGNITIFRQISSSLKSDLGIFDVQDIQDVLVKVINDKYINTFFVPPFDSEDEYLHGDMNAGDLVPSLNHNYINPTSLSFFGMVNGKLTFDDSFNKLYSKVSLSFGAAYNIYSRFKNIEISKNAFNGVGFDYLNVVGLDWNLLHGVIFSSDEIEFGLSGRAFHFHGNLDESIKENDYTLNFNYGYGLTSEEKGIETLEVVFRNDAVNYNLKLSQFPALKTLKLITKGDIILDNETLLDNIETVEIESMNLSISKNL